MSTVELDELLNKYDEYLTNSIETLGAQNGLSPPTTAQSRRPAGKHLTTRRPAGYNQRLHIERSDGIEVELRCPVCQLSSFDDIDSFLDHLIEQEELPLFEDDQDLEMVKEMPDFLALEFGRVLSDRAQSLQAVEKLRMLRSDGQDPNTQLYIEKESPGGPDQENQFKFLRKRLEGNDDFESILQEVTQ